MELEVHPGRCIGTVVILTSGIALTAQQGQRGGGPPQAPQTPQAAAPIDLTGNWVSVVTEDWRWRMVTPPKGDFASVPLNAEGQKVGNSWDPATDGSCLAYGAAGLMRNPTRVRITWENDRTLKIETDAGVQTRRFVFGDAKPPASARCKVTRSPNGRLPAPAAAPPRRGRGGPPPGPRRGSLKVTTTMMSAGWLRKNGAPYSENATMTEYLDRFAAPDGEEWFAVTTIVSDQKYLNTDFVTSTHFKKEADGAKWSPKPCKS